MTRIVLLGLICVVLSPFKGGAEPIFTITCYEPKGHRFDYGPPPEDWLKDKRRPPRLVESKDGYMGVTPVFVVDSSKPTKMLVFWGDTKKVPFNSPVEAQEAAIVLWTENRITAIEVKDVTVRSSVEIHSFFPKLGIAYFSGHGYNLFANNTTAQAFFARCDFNPPVPPRLSAK